MSAGTYAKSRPKLSSAKRAELSATRAAELKELRLGLEKFQAETSSAEIAEIIARFDGYSALNAQRIAMQLPAATDVRPFSEWIKAGYSPPAKSALGRIRIVAPRQGKKDAGDDAAADPEDAATPDDS